MRPVSLLVILIALSTPIMAADPTKSGLCPYKELHTRDFLHASITSQELLEIVRRIDAGNNAGARALADSYLDDQIEILKQLSKSDISSEDKSRALSVIDEVKNYRDPHMK